METQTQEKVERRAVVGSLKSENEVQALRDAWAEAPFFGAPTQSGQESEHITTLNPGDTIAANFHGLRLSNRKGPASKQRWYAILATEDGQKLRLFTPANLKGQLQDKESGEYRVPIGSYVEITYLGMQVVEGVNDDKPIHQFDMKVGKDAIN